MGEKSEEYINPKLFQRLIFIGWLIGTLLILYLGLDKINPNDLRFALSASAQAFAAVFVLGLIVIYNHVQFMARLILEVENRVFNFFSSTIGWFYPYWNNERMREHINADFDESGFRNSYLIIQFFRHFKYQMESPKSLIGSSDDLNMYIKTDIQRDKDTHETNLKSTASKIAERLGNSNLTDKVLLRFQEVDKQAKLLNDAIKKREDYRVELEKFSKGLILPTSVLVIVVSLSLIGLFLISRGSFTPFGYDMGGFWAWQFIIMGIFSTWVLVMNVYQSIVQIRKILKGDN